MSRFYFDNIKLSSIRFPSQINQVFNKQSSIFFLKSTIYVHYVNLFKKIPLKLNIFYERISTRDEVAYTMEQSSSVDCRLRTISKAQSGYRHGRRRDFCLHGKHQNLDKCY